RGGIIQTVAGTGAFSFSGDSGTATHATLYEPAGIAIGPDNSLYILDSGNYRIRQMQLPLSGFSPSEIEIPSEDGSKVYGFDGSGRHLRTLDALTGAVRFEFAYDSGGRLISIKDVSGNFTRIERDAQGNPTDIVAPFGQRTALTVDANGFLAAVTNPANDAVQLTSTPDGLLTQLTDARGGTHSF